MNQDKGAELSQMAAELFYLREAAKAAGEHFLGFLIEMAAVEAEKLGVEGGVSGAQTDGGAVGRTIGAGIG